MSGLEVHVSVRFTFVEVEAILAAHYGVLSAKRVAFRSRLKALQKYGVPSNLQASRGRPAQFDIDQVYQFALAVELTVCGLSPQVAARIALNSWWHQRQYIVAVLLDFQKVEELFDRTKDAQEGRLSLGWMWSVPTFGFSDLSRRDHSLSDRTVIEAVTVFETETITEWSSGTVMSDWRRVLINPAIFVSNLAVEIILLKEVSLDALIESFEQIEPHLDKVARMIEYSVNFRLDVVMRPTSDESENRISVDEFIQTAVEEAERWWEYSAGPRILALVVTTDGSWEINLLRSSPEDRKKLSSDEEWFVERRKKGQADLEKLGILKMPENPGFEDGEFTEKGLRFLREFHPVEELVHVDPQA